MEVNLDRLQEASAALGLKRDVAVITRPRLSHEDWLGEYHGPQWDGAHLIALRDDIVISASCLLAHELIHCQQCERFGSFRLFLDAWKRDYAELRSGHMLGEYMALPLEREPYEAQDQNPWPDLIPSGACARVV